MACLPVEICNNDDLVMHINSMLIDACRSMAETFVKDLLLRLCIPPVHFCPVLPVHEHR